MAHSSHAEDTLFVVAEPDFRFMKEEAESQRHEFDMQEAVVSRYATWSLVPRRGLALLVGPARLHVHR